MSKVISTRDFGRGLQIEHFTLNENQEKLNAPYVVIGKFGVGLKDALATFHRKGIVVLIISSFGKTSFYNIFSSHIIHYINIFDKNCDLIQCRSIYATLQ